MFTQHLNAEETRQSIIMGLGFDYDGVTRPEVIVHSFHWHDSNMRGTICDVVISAWGEPHKFKGQWCSVYGWWFEGDDMPDYID